MWLTTERLKEIFLKANQKPKREYFDDLFASSPVIDSSGDGKVYVKDDLAMPASKIKLRGAEKMMCQTARGSYEIM
jgi:hypothetical protein